MFYVFCRLTPLYRRFRLSRVSQTQEREEIYRLVSKILNFTPCGSVFDRFCVEALEIVENQENNVLRSLPFHYLISVFQALSCLANARA